MSLDSTQYSRAKALVKAIINNASKLGIPSNIAGLVAIATAGHVMGESGFHIDKKSWNSLSSAGGLFQWCAWKNGSWGQLYEWKLLPGYKPISGLSSAAQGKRCREYVTTNFNFEQQLTLGLNFQIKAYKSVSHFRSNMQKFVNNNGLKLNEWTLDMAGWWGHNGGNRNNMIKNETTGSGKYNTSQLNSNLRNKINYSNEIYSRIKADGGVDNLPDINIETVDGSSTTSNSGGLNGNTTRKIELEKLNITPNDGGVFSKNINTNNSTPGLILGTHMNQK